ncbi:MAG: PASTA domain-containing protein, partial [Erysipelotrichaceae bacterium]|nr:PASTA domain-containing protein [Erysipelotrichaceae bacterium]
AYAHSYNSGVLTLLAEHINDDEYIRYLDAFGFFKYVDSFGIEEGNNPGNRAVINPVERATTTYGQGSSVTALQMVQAYSAICNDGIMVKPYIIDKIVDHNTNEVVYSASTTIAGQPIKAETAAQVLDLMKYAVDTYVTVYKMKGINVGGKTGTADVATSKGYDGTTIHSIMLAVPIEDPKALIYFCYQDHIWSNAYFQPYVKETLETVASVLNLYDTEKDAEITTKTVYQNGAPVLINHTLDFARSKVNALQCNLVIIGNGQSVIRQYPDPGTTVVSGQNIMVLLNDDGISMPDMNGWSRKDVTAFWDLTGIAIEIDGFGYVCSQNIPPGQLIDANTEIKVSLQQK